MERKGSPFRPRVNDIDYSRRVLPIDTSADPQSFVVLSDGGGMREYDRETWGELFAWTNVEGGGGASNYWNGTSAMVNSAGLVTIKWSEKQAKSAVKINGVGLTSIDAIGIMHNAPQIVASAPEHVALIDMETGRAIRNVQLEYEWISTLLFEAVPNHPGIALQSLVSDGQLRVWDFNSKNTHPIKKIPGIGAYPHHFQFNPTNLNEFICGSNGAPVKIFDFTAGRAIHSIASGANYSHHSIYGNVVLQTKSASGEAGVSIVEEPDEEVMTFTCGGSGEETTCCTLTSTSAIVVCSNSFAEFRYSK